MAGLLNACDLAVYSSRREGCSNSVLECGLAALAVVGTDIPGIRMAVSAENHPFLVPASAGADMAARMLELYRNPGLRSEVGIANQKHVAARFSVAGMVDAFQARFEADAPVGKSRK
jgi:glycosyltransferase involved in cell wall biosynthesis